MSKIATIFTLAGALSLALPAQAIHSATARAAEHPTPDATTIAVTAWGARPDDGHDATTAHRPAVPPAAAHPGTTLY